MEMEIIKQLERTKAETLKYFDLLDEDLQKRHGPGKWTVGQLLHHLADAETVLFDRIRRIISEPRQVLWAFDQDRWAANLNYPEMPLELSRNIYSSVRDGVIYHAQKHYIEKGHFEFVHSEAGVRTLREEIDKVAWHNEHHLEQIRKALSAF